MNKDKEYEQIGSNDLRFADVSDGGFHHVALRDADDGDLIIVNEDDIPALIARLQRHVHQHSLATTPERHRRLRTSAELQRAVARFILRSFGLAAQIDKIFFQLEAMGKDPDTDKEITTILTYMEQSIRKCYQEELGTDLPTATNTTPQNAEKKGRPITHPLYHADPECEHEHDENCYSGIRCRKCGGWYCL